MSRHRGKILAALAVALSGCVSAETTSANIESSWAGHPSDEFFVKYGPPISEFKLDNGSRLLRWSSGVSGYTAPGFATTTGTVSGGVVSLSTYGTGSREVSLTCELDLQVDQAGRIVDVRVAKDTLGWWQLSRCSEYLKL